ncbi:MAG: sugar phosphate isomerase/epimerase family protein [Syntrophales bacterium]
MIKYGVEMLLFTDSFAEDKIGLIKKAKSLGFDGVEILIGDPTGFPVKAVKDTLKEENMAINFAVALGPETNTISPDEKARKAGNSFLKACIDVAYETTGGNCVIGGPNYAAWCYLTGLSPTADEWRWAVSNYKDVCGYAAKKNITMAVEVLNRYETHLFNTVTDACRFCSDVGSENAKVQLDTYHMNMEEKSWGQPIRAAGKKIGYMHVIENDRGIVGTGLVKWEELFRALRDISYNGWLTIEGFTRDSQGLAGLTKIWRDPAKCAEILATESLKALKSMEANYC